VPSPSARENEIIPFDELGESIDGRDHARKQLNRQSGSIMMAAQSGLSLSSLSWSPNPYNLRF
jgi:hypothetical protein